MENSLLDATSKFSFVSSYVFCLLIFPIWVNRNRIKDDTELFTTIMLTLIIATQFLMNLLRDFFLAETYITEYIADVLGLVFSIGLFARWFNLDKMQTIASFVIIIPSLYIMAHGITFEFVYSVNGEWIPYESPGLILLYLHVIIIAILSLMLGDRIVDKKLTEFQIKIFKGIRMYAFITVFSAPLLFSNLSDLGYGMHSVASLSEFFFFFKAYRVK